MASRNRYFKMLLVILPLILTACKRSQASLTPTQLAPEAALTAAAQTADARLLEMRQLTPSATPVPPTPTTQVATFTPIPPTTTSTPITPTVTATSGVSGGIDDAVFTMKETIPDGTSFSPGTKFVKSWQFINSGSSTWTTAYSLAFVNGDAMSGPSTVPVPVVVAPGKLVDIPVNLVAPSTPGSYKGYWRLRNPAGTSFGTTVFVQINVAAGETPTVAPTPSGSETPAATPTPTSTGSAAGTATPTSTLPAAVVTGVTLSVGDTTFSGACPHTFIFTAGFTVNSHTTVTYQLEAGGFPQMVLPPPNTEILNAGAYTPTYLLEFTGSGSGWARLHVTAPVDITSNEVTFSLTCQR